MKRALIFFLLIAASAIAQQKTNTIKGKVTYLQTPLANAEVRLVSSGETVKTNIEGAYEIKGSPGDVITYSYPSMRPMEIIIEDITRVLNVTLNPEINELDEVIVKKTVLKSQKQLRAEYATNKGLINTAFGIVDRETTSFAIRMIDGEALNPIGIDIATALQFRLPGIRVERTFGDPQNPVIYLRGSASGMFPAVYDIDGLILNDFPSFLQVENIERVALISGLGAVTKYGGAANGGVIVINTKGANYFSEPGTDKPFDQAKLRNNEYDASALNAADLKNDQPQYLKRLLAGTTEAEAMAVYEEQIKMYKGSSDYVLDAYDYFSNRWKNTDYADGIISRNSVVFDNDPTALKALAYTYQAQGRFKKSNETYKDIFILRPNYAQSYMDIANSYREVGAYQKAAGIYARYAYLLEQGFLKAEGDLGIIMDRELNNLVALKGKGLLNRRELKKLILDDEFDGTRLVFEWNTSEAEFELQFVNPEGTYYTSEHSILADAERIKNEKKSGFSSEEYLIDDSLRGQWRINAKYLGNKSLTPTYLKTTIYYNYGSASQRKVTKVFTLRLQNVNLELFTLSNATRVVSN